MQHENFKLQLAGSINMSRIDDLFKKDSDRANTLAEEAKKLIDDPIKLNDVSGDDLSSYITEYRLKLEKISVIRDGMEKDLLKFNALPRSTS